MNNQIIEKESAEFCVVLAVQKGLRLHACQHCLSGRGTCLLRNFNKMNDQIIEKESPEFCVVLAVQ